MRSIQALPVCALAGLLLSACGELVQPADSVATLHLEVRLVGNAIDPDGFTVTVDGATYAVTGDTTLNVEALRSGYHDAAFADLAPHCHPTREVEGLELASGADGEATIEVRCVGRVAFDYGANASEYKLGYMDEEGRISVLTSGPTDRGQIEWSPDGKRIALSLRVNADYEMYVLELDGLRLTRLTDHTGTDSHPSWSPDGTQLAYALEDPALPGVPATNAVWAMGADGSNRRLIASRPLTSYTDLVGPRWSANGADIAFTGPPFPVSGQFNVWSVAPDGSNRRRLSNLSAGRPAGLAWSPDGTKLAFTALNGGVYEIQVVSRNGQIVTTIPAHAPGASPTWSPDGTRMLYISDNGTLWVVNADGTSPRQISPSVATARAPAWAADGSYAMAYLSTVPGLAVIELDGPARAYSVPLGVGSVIGIYPRPR